MAQSAYKLLLCYLTLLFCTAQATHEAGIFHFDVLISSWTGCRPLDYSAGCSRWREAACVRDSDNQTAPWYYCTERGLQRPDTMEDCSPCSQNCAVSQWSDWSRCDCDVNWYRNRTRDVISPARNGGDPCPALLDREPCPCAFVGSFDTQPRTHTWKTGEWGTCQALNTSSQCGAGLRTRQVMCVNLQGDVVAASSCLEEKAYSSIIPPALQTYCEVPCPCLVGGWGNFSSCNPQCEQRVATGIRIRRRPVLQVPTHDLSCLATVETEPCSINSNSCPIYYWSASAWSPFCNFQTGTTCGTGYQTRYIYCLETWNGTTRNVGHSRCEKLASESQPAGISVCNVRCPESCVVGDWSEWSECPKSCKQTYSNRTREVLVLPFQEVCPQTLELRPCPVLPCSRWLAAEYQPCIPTGSNCGDGFHSRDVSCVGPDDESLVDRMCAGLSRPATSITCRKPCADECVLSSWSGWTLCSQTCGGVVGNQTRTRQFLANGTSCPQADASLQETRSCNSAEACNPPIYSVRYLPWGECMADSLNLRGSGASPTEDMLNGLASCGENGTRNRTAVCLKDGQVVQPSDCPISYQKLEVEHCELPCSRECVFSEWSPYYSNCSASCGIGMRKRSRRLLQWSSSDSDPCVVDDEGLDYEYDMCISPCTGGGMARGVAWYTSNWTQCHSYEGFPPQGNCGVGYQSRDVKCVNLGTGRFISELECTSLEMSRPSAVRSCHVQCSNKCLVTEWSELSPCTRDGIQTRQRTIVPYRGCSDWRTCCPHLTSILLEQNISCSDPAKEREYEYIFVDFRFSSCIFDDPSKVCGVGGMRYRKKACVVKFTRDPVDESFCSEIISNSRDTDECTVKCERDCVQSNWTSWSACPSTCGFGLRTRTRETISEPVEGGRKCGPDLETDVCMNTPCPVVEILPGPFSACSPSNTSASCGDGYRTRQALCLVNDVSHELEVCHRMGVVNSSFNLMEACTSPCPGECVVSEWGEWSPCNTNCPVGSCQRKRTREILRQSDPPCSTSTQELETCYTPVNQYRWEAGPWQDCIVSFNSSASPTPGQYCGQGQQQRILSCVNGSSGIVHEQFCVEAGITKPQAIQGCSVPCPIDCKVGTFSDWSECTGCRLSVQRRERQVNVHPNAEGIQCPELVQERQCAPVGCVNQTIISHAPLDSVEYTSEGQCGAVLRYASFSCTQNTEYVSPDQCQGATSSAAEYATLPCPSAPACTYTDWSDWSDCTNLCADPGELFQFRYKRLITSSPGLSEECESAQLQIQECVMPIVENWNNSEIMNTTSKPTAGSWNQCIAFKWSTSEWSGDQRDVYCQSLTDIRVNDAACPLFIKPLSRNETCANVSCPSYATCSVSNGECLQTCQANFEEVESQCLPVRGCVDHTHCLIPNTECDTDTGSCKCRENYVRAETGDLCVLTETTATPSSTTAVSSNTTLGGGATTDVSVNVTTEEPGSSSDVSVGINPPGFQLSTLHIVLIGAVPLLLLILLVVILIVITCRCSRNLERKHKQRVVQRQRTKASISSPSPTPRRFEMRRRVTDSNSSGFVEGPDADHYGLPGSSFLPDGQADDCIDEPSFSPPRFNGGPPLHPIPVAAPTTPGYRVNIQRDTPLGSPVRLQPVPYSYRRPYFSDGGMTDMTYTTDDDETMGTASVAPSSPGSPSTSRRHIPTHIPESSTHLPEENALREAPENPYVSMHRGSPIYARVRTSGGPKSPVSPVSPGHHSRKHHLNPGEKDGRIALGLDNSMVRAANQIVAGQPTPNTPSSTRSAGTNSGKRRSGRRRRSHTHRHPPRMMWYQDPHYHYFNDGRRAPCHDGCHSDRHYSSDHNLNSASDAEYNRNTLPPHIHQSGHRQGYEDHHRLYYRGEEGHYRGNGHPSHSNYYSSREGDSQGGRLSSTSTRSRPLDSSPQHSSPVRHRGQSHTSSHDYPLSSTCRFSSPEHRHHSPEESHCLAPVDYRPHHSCTEHLHHTHHSCTEHPHHTHGASYRYYSDRDYHYSDQDRRSSDRSRCSPERSYHSPNGTRHSSDWDQGSLERSHSSSCRHQDSPHHHYDRQPSSVSYDVHRHASFRQDMSPIINPPPEFAPPVPPHANLATPIRAGDNDTYDYPTCYQPGAVRKLKGSENDVTSPYARPRPHHLRTSSPQEGRITSPYDYPRIKNAGLSTPPTSSGHVTPTSPTKQAAVSNVAFTNPVYDMHQLQHEMGAYTAGNDERDNVTSQAIDSSPALENPAPHSSMMPNQSSSSLGFTPQTMVNPQLRNESGLIPQPRSNTTAVSQPATSTPLQSSLQVPPNLTIRVTPSQDGLSPHVSPHTSPLLSSWRHPPSPLVFNSASMSDGSPRTSGELD